MAAQLAFLQNLGVSEWLIILLIVLLLFGGATKLPKLARGMGAGVKEFKKGLQEGTSEDPPAAGEVKKDAEPDRTPSK